MLLFSVDALASGPVLPEKYRLLSDDELSADWRNKDAERYAAIAADLNGDGLVDGCFLAIDKKTQQLVLLVVLIGNAGNSEKWIVLATLNYTATKYMGIEAINPSTLMVYSSIGDNMKIKKTINTYSIKFFASEGSSSLFYWNKNAKNFERLWLTK